MEVKRHNNDPFAVRNGGFRIEVANDEDGGISDVFQIDSKLFCITKKSITNVILPDVTDPERTNPAIPISQQKTFPYGTDDPFVGRTLLQAKELFVDFALPSSVDTAKGLAIAFSFLKEIAVLHEVCNLYISKEKEANLNLKNIISREQTLLIPSIDGLEQAINQMVSGTDHAMRNIVNTVQLFYPKVPITNWVNSLIDELKNEKDASQAIEFVQSIKQWVWLVRNLRNSIEHPKIDDKIELQNYQLNKAGLIEKPTIAFINNDTPFTEMPVQAFLKNTLENLIACFEGLVAHLCNVHAQPFADGLRSVIEIKQEECKKHIRYKYHINLTQ